MEGEEATEATATEESRSIHTPTQPPVHHKEAYLKKVCGWKAYVIESNHERDMALTGALSCMDLKIYQYTMHQYGGDADASHRLP